jgi:Predicted hydrolases or acyltransferases (alpha/beta hydrolase superfamily)
MKEMTSIQGTENWIQCRGGKLYSKSWTPKELVSDEAVLLFHDSLGCVSLWRDFPERLSLVTGRRVIAYDRLGFGHSDLRTDAISRDFVRDEARTTVPTLLDALSVGKFIACGHSVGGGMAVETAAAFPDTCTGVVTIAAQAFVEDRTIEGIRRAQVEFSSPEGFSRLSKYHGSKTSWVLDAWIETWLAPEFSEWNLDDALSRIQCPVLAVHGEVDQYGTIAHPQRIAEGRGNYTILPGVGHNPHREATTELVAVIREWLDHRFDVVAVGNHRGHSRRAGHLRWDRNGRSMLPPR